MTVDGFNSFNFNNLGYLKKSGIIPEIISKSIPWENLEKYIGGENISLQYQVTEEKIDNIDTIVRTDSKLLKIIKLPYCPVDIFTMPEVGIVSPNYTRLITINWGSAITPIIKKYLEIDNNYSDFLLNDVENEETPFINLFTTLPTEDTRHDENESKLLNSEFDFTKYTYDTFSFIFEKRNIIKKY